MRAPNKHSALRSHSVARLTCLSVCFGCCWWRVQAYFFLSNEQSKTQWMTIFDFNLVGSHFTIGLPSLLLLRTLRHGPCKLTA